MANPPPIYRDAFIDANFDKLALFEAFAKEHDYTVGELAIAWLLSYPWTGSVIAGATSAKQLVANVKAAEWKLGPTDIIPLEKML